MLDNRVYIFNNILLNNQLQYSQLSYNLLEKIIFKDFNVLNVKIIKRGGEKPYISHYHFNYDFNISHTNGAICIGLSSGKIGVDIEEIRLIDKNVIELFCSQNEIFSLNKLNDSDFYNYLFKIWTIKESILKANGLGISEQMKNIHIDIELLKKNNFVLINFNNVNWYVYSCIYDKYAFSVALNNDNKIKLSYNYINFS